jgi:hypothetical protein
MFDEDVGLLRSKSDQFPCLCIKCMLLIPPSSNTSSAQLSHAASVAHPSGSNAVCISSTVSTFHQQNTQAGEVRLLPLAPMTSSNMLFQSSLTTPTCASTGFLTAVMKSVTAWKSIPSAWPSCESAMGRTIEKGDALTISALATGC